MTTAIRKKRHTFNYTEMIKNKITGFGADLVGIADIEPLKGLRIEPPGLLDPFTSAVSIAVKLPVAVFEQIDDRPTPIYKSVYTTANLILDEIAFRTAMALQNDGFHSLPIAASQVLDTENWYAAISHKAVARMAGLGWQGKNLLLITPQYGSRVRLATILTQAPLDVDGLVKNRCGDCTACFDACPAQAIKGVNTQTHYNSRNEAMYFSRCVEKVTGEFAQIPEVGVPICGICIKVCPFGRKMHAKETNER
ncbi:MAG: 4Fe-4S double cluster binding domain-containing protein [Thermodesulfobacteriota bacterium]|nr:4Fe-4S double cluster binding domain-containing protein [Thermodesulfobacteriota bacterium]